MSEQNEERKSMKRRMIVGTLAVAAVLGVGLAAHAGEGEAAKKQVMAEMRKGMEAQGMTKEQIHQAMKQVEQQMAAQSDPAKAAELRKKAEEMQKKGKPGQAMPVAIVPADPVVPTPAGEIRNGSNVLVYDDEENLWYPARVIKVEKDKYTVKYYDEDEKDEAVERDEIRPESIAVGMAVKIYDDDDKLVDATVVKRNGNKLVVKCGDENERVDLGDVVVPPSSLK